MTLIEIAKSRGILVVTIVLGRAYSCGSLLAIHGDYRYMYKYSQHLIHLGRQGTTVKTFKQIERENKKSTEHFNNIVKMYKENTKMTEKDIRKHLEDDNCFLNADECLEKGFVDEIIPRTIKKKGKKIC